MRGLRNQELAWSPTAASTLWLATLPGPSPAFSTPGVRHQRGDRPRAASKTRRGEGDQHPHLAIACDLAEIAVLPGVEVPDQWAQDAWQAAHEWWDSLR